MKRYLIIIIFYCLPLITFSQEVNLDSISPPKDEKIGKFLFAIDSRNSVFSGEWVKMFGFRSGMELMERYRMGVGVYWLTQPVELRNDFNRKITLSSFSYATVFTEYVFHQNFRWTASAIMSIGQGNAQLHDQDLVQDSVSIKTINKIPLFAANAAGYYYVTPWLAPGVGVGFRAVRGGDERIKQTFTSPVYVIKVKIILGRLFKCIFKREEIKAERDQYRAEKQQRKNK